MLETNLCEICKRNCTEAEKKRCLSHPKLNIGSGVMLLPNYINFDKQILVCGSKTTDVVGDIKRVSELFPANVFEEILCVHVIEHFYPSDGVQLLRDCYSLLRSGGKLIVEGPDVQKIARIYINEPSKLIQELYGRELHLQQWGEHWWHKWGWTGELLASAMSEVGFVGCKVSAGTFHCKPERDFRVTGVHK